MPQKELEIPSSVRSYQEYPEIIEFEGCPRCNSLDVNPKIVNFKMDAIKGNDIKFEITCFNCGLLYNASEKMNSKTARKTILLEWED
jgi:transcription elongation factor Elf1